MSTYCKQFGLKTVAWFLMIIVMMLPTLLIDADAKTPFFKEIKKIVVIDPGHGGHDTGAAGPDKSQEKNITLEMATALTSELKNEYKVELTRTGDYGLDIPGRANMANHLEADLFISIHTGGSFLHNAGGIIIFYFQEFPGQSPASDSKTPESFKDGDVKIPWDKIQSKHTGSSSILAKSIQTRINEAMKFSKCKVQSAPLMVLRGADMPAVLIEIGYLTNPAQEKVLNDPGEIVRLAAAISTGIDDFFSKFE
jgi:N-acetylmuramoyl-L-alanine amidase